MPQLPTDVQVPMPGSGTMAVIAAGTEYEVLAVVERSDGTVVGYEVEISGRHFRLTASQLAPRTEEEG